MSLCVIVKCSFSNQQCGKLLPSSAVHIQIEYKKIAFSEGQVKTALHSWYLFVYLSGQQTTSEHDIQLYIGNILFSWGWLDCIGQHSYS